MKAWIARDKDNGLFLFYTNPPEKNYDSNQWFGIGDLIAIYDDELPKGVNPQWSDEYPIEVELIIKEKEEQQ